jgi:hypothetical protein
VRYEQIFIHFLWKNKIEVAPGVCTKVINYCGNLQSMSGKHPSNKPEYLILNLQQDAAYRNEHEALNLTSSSDIQYNVLI